MSLRKYLMASVFMDGDAVPEAFVCPITREQMVDPVVALDGHSYSRLAVQTDSGSPRCAQTSCSRVNSSCQTTASARPWSSGETSSVSWPCRPSDVGSCTCTILSSVLCALQGGTATLLKGSTCDTIGAQVGRCDAGQGIRIVHNNWHRAARKRAL